MSQRAKQRILYVIVIAAVVATAFAPRIAQDPLYHDFAASGGGLTLPNPGNILSNLLFLWVGVHGLYLLGRGQLQLLGGIYPAYLAFFAALPAIAAASAYYHWSPDNPSLALDRLAMSVAFVSFLSILLAERLSLAVARWLFPLLLLAGPVSIVYWHYSELAGHGDLRAYVLVQFLPILLTPLLLWLFAPRYDRGADIAWMLAWYLLAKLCEVLDHEIYAWTGWLSGHAAKHLLAGVACLVFLHHLRRRKPVSSSHPAA